MDRENTPLKQRQKRGGNASRRSSTSSSSSAAATGKSASAPSTAAATAAAASAAATSGASARAFRPNNTRTRTKTPSPSAAAGVAVSGAAPAMILAKHPPTILKTPALYNPDAPPVMRSSPPPAAPQARYSDGPAGYLHVNTRQQHAEHAQLYSRHSTGGGDGPVRTLYQPPPSSSPSVKKLGQQHHAAGAAVVATAGTPAPTLLRPPVVPMSSEAHPSNIVAPPTSVKLITPQYQFATDLSSKLSGCLELTSFTVVGVLGFDGVGKSTLLSLLHGADDRGTRKQRESPTPSPRSKKTSGSRGASTTGTTAKGSESVFTPQSFEKLVAGDVETSGVDMAVSHDPTGAIGASLVLLDTQPMLSSAMLYELLSKNESPRFGALTPEQQVEAHSFQLATFLLSVCHYVVIAHDALADLQIVRFLQQAEAKLQNCRLPHISGGVKEKHVAKLLFVVTRTPDAALLCKEQQMLARHMRALESAWPGAFYRSARHASSTALQPRESENASPNKPSQQPPQIPVLALPPKPSRSNARAHGDYDDAVLRWRKFVQRLPNAPSFSRNPTSPHAMNLREWLSNASRVFESVRKSGVFTSDFHSGGRDHH